jgi:uncharacterized NAD(P)/FAD-binding protein YdhS
MPLFRRVRTEADRALAAGGTWQSVIDALRPVTQALWQGWSDAERRRFLTHLRPAWDVHRHRVAPSVGAALDAARAGGRLSIHAGRIRSIVAQGATAAVTWQPRGLAERRVLHVARVVNCTGASSDVTRTAHPLIQSLLRDGFARPDPRRLGLDVSAAGAIRDCTGATSGRLFGIGPVCRGALWEIVAVPDIRQQCERLASHLAAIARFGDGPPVQKCTEQSSDTATIVASSYGASSSPSLPGGSA